MQPEAVLITTPRIDFDRLLSVSHQALGYSISAAADSSQRPKGDVDKFLSCLASIRDPKGVVTPNLFAHVAFSVMVACDEEDALEVIECASGVAVISSETVAKGVVLMVASGTLAQWRDAVVTGSRRTGTVRLLFNRIMAQFESFGLNPWTDYVKKPQTNGFLLEHKR